MDANAVPDTVAQNSPTTEGPATRSDVDTNAAADTATDTEKS